MPAPAPAQAAAREIGTVVSVGQDSLVLKPDKPADATNLTISIAAGGRVLQLAPGSTDLKTAQPAEVSDIAVGDRVLVTGAAGESVGTFLAKRVVLMKSAAIAQQHEAEETDWQRRGSGGIVTAVDPAAGTITIASGARKVTVTTTPKTNIRRYSQGSVRFTDAVKATVADMHPGDQLRVRGARSEDGQSIAAEEIVSGTFAHVSGTILTVDATTHVLTLRDLRTKKVVTIELADSSSVRTLPPEVADRFAAHSKAAGRPSGSASGSGAAGAPAHGGAQAASVTSAAGEHGERAADLGQLVARLPETPQTSLHKGEAVMVVGMPKGGTDSLIAVTLLAGVEPILAANPNGEADAALSPWNLGGAPEGGS